MSSRSLNVLEISSSPKSICLDRFNVLVPVRCQARLDNNQRIPRDNPCHLARRAVMTFLQTGISLSHAPLSVLERVAIANDELGPQAKVLSDTLGEDGCATVISTCNRTELYANLEDVGTGIEAMVEFMQMLADRHIGLARLDISPYMKTRTGIDCARHLFSVASGVDSLITGDAQVASQVRAGLHALGDAPSTVNHGLSRLFHAALRTGRRVGKHLDTQHYAQTVPAAGVSLLRDRIGTLADSKALVIGAGETAQLAASELQRHGVSDLYVTSRRAENAVRFAAAVGGTPISMGEQLADTLADVDVVVACTASPVPVLNIETVRSAVERRTEATRPLHMLDLGVPRDIEAAIASLDSVNLYTIEDLRDAYSSARDADPDTAATLDLVHESADRFIRDWDARNEIRAIGMAAESIRSRELGRTLKSLHHLSDSDRDAIDAMTKSIVKSVLAGPISGLRERDS